MTDCIFCKIASGEIPCYKVYEDQFTVAFLDIHPHCKGHTVVIPKIHVMNTFDLSDAQLQQYFFSVQKTMKRIQKVLDPEGYNVGWNHGTAGEQIVPHLHVHILPRYYNDGGGSIHSIIKNPGNESVEEVARKFKEKK